MKNWPIGYDASDWGELAEVEMDADIVHRVGLFFIHWSILEEKLDLIFAVFFKLDLTWSLVVTSGINFRHKINVLKSANHLLRDVFGAEANDDIAEILKSADFYGSEWRNNLAHSTYHGKDSLVKFSAHGRLKGIF